MTEEQQAYETEETINENEEEQCLIIIEFEKGSGAIKAMKDLNITAAQKLLAAEMLRVQAEFALNVAFSQEMQKAQQVQQKKIAQQLRAQEIAHAIVKDRKKK